MIPKGKRPRDPNQLAAMIVGLSTGDIQQESGPEKNPAAVALGRLGGQKGGDARAKTLDSSRRSEIAKTASKARWRKGAD